MKKIIAAGALILAVAGGTAIGSHTSVLSQAAAQTEASGTSDQSYNGLCNSATHTHGSEECRFGQDCPAYNNEESSNTVCDVCGGYHTGGHHNERRGYAENRKEYDNSRHHNSRGHHNQAHHGQQW